MAKSKGSRGTAAKGGAAPSAHKSAGAPPPPAVAPPPRRRGGSRRRGGLTVCILVFFFVTSVLVPGVFLFGPDMVPPLPDDPTRTMQGGPARTLGVRALWSAVQRNRKEFCAETGAPDTIRCLLTVWHLTWALLRAPASVDAYVALPYRTWLRRAANEELPGQGIGEDIPISPVAMDQRWVEGTVSETGQTRAQIARLVLQANRVSGVRLPPMGTASTLGTAVYDCLPRQVQKIPCLEEYERAFSVGRVPVLAADAIPCGRPADAAQLAQRDAILADPAVLGSGRPKAFYAFGVQVAADFLRNVPHLSEDVPVTVVIFPASDTGRRWYALTRGREYCSEDTFRAHYEDFWKYVAWTTRPRPDAALPLPKQTID